MVVVKFQQKIRRIRTVHPLRTVFDRIIFRLACLGITQNHTSNGLAAKQADVELLHRAYPVRNTVIIDLKTDLIEHVSRITESQMTVNVAVKQFRLGIPDRLIQHHQFRLLSRHIDLHICRNTFRLVGEPFDRAGIDQRGDTHRYFLIIDLRIQVADFKLGNHIHDASHLSFTKDNRAVPVKDRDLIKTDLRNILCEISFLLLHQVVILLCIDDR